MTGVARPPLRRHERRRRVVLPDDVVDAGSARCPHHAGAGRTGTRTRPARASEEAHEHRAADQQPDPDRAERRDVLLLERQPAYCRRAPLTTPAHTPKTPPHPPPRSSKLLRQHHRVAEHADALDLDLDDVARLQRHLRVARPADAGRRAGQDQVAGLERERCSRCRRRETARRRSGRACCRPAGPRRSAAARRGGRAVAELGDGHELAPSGQNVSKPLARVHWLSEYWMLRAERSFATR